MEKDGNMEKMGNIWKTIVKYMEQMGNIWKKHGKD